MAIETISLYLPLTLIPFIFFLPANPGVYVFAVTQLLLDILFLNGPHPVLTYFQILSNPTFKKTILEYKKEYPRLPTILTLACCFLLAFNFVLPLLAFRSGVNLTGSYLVNIFILSALIPTFYHILWQIRGLSLTYNAAYLKANIVPENVLLEVRRSQQVERRLTPVLFLLFLIQCLQFVFKVSLPATNMLIYGCYGAVFLFMLFVLLRLPAPLRRKKAIFLSRLVLLPFCFTTVWVYFFFKTTHSIEYISVVSRTQAASRAKPVFFARALLLISIILFIVLGNAGAIFFGFNYDFAAHMTPWLVLAFAVDNTTTQMHVIFDILLYRMRSQWVREMIGPLVSFGIDLSYSV